MGQQEGFRTPAGGGDAAPDAPAAPFFDERSAQKAAPVVPLEKVARRSRFAIWAGGGWRATVRSPQFRRSWPLALLLVATLAAAVAASNIYSRDDAARTNAAPAAETSTAASADAETNAAPQAREGIGDRSVARDARRESDAAPDEKAVGNPEAFAASALGSFNADDGDADREHSAAARDERSAESGKRHKRSKRGRGARRGNGGGAILFDVIR